jgi:hypothetical protein
MTRNYPGRRCDDAPPCHQPLVGCPNAARFAQAVSLLGERLSVAHQLILLIRFSSEVRRELLGHGGALTPGPARRSGRIAIMQPPFL